jgi:hypothetical protein
MVRNRWERATYISEESHRDGGAVFRSADQTSSDDDCGTGPTLAGSLLAPRLNFGAQFSGKDQGQHGGLRGALCRRHRLSIDVDYVLYYHDDRTHLALAKGTPADREPEKNPNIGCRVVSVPRLGGLHHRYGLAA